MPKKPSWLIRIVIPNSTESRFMVSTDNNPDLMPFVECLRYAGLLTHEHTENAFVINIRAPEHLNGDVWADQNAQRMKTFGFNVEAMKLP